MESKQLIRSKNRKLRELIEYIKKLHFLLAYYNLNPEEIEKMKTPPHIVESIAARTETIRKEAAAVEEEIDFTPVEEILIDEEGKETVPVSSQG